MAKTPVFALLESSKLISRKIWVMEKSWNFHTGINVQSFWSKETISDMNIIFPNFQKDFMMNFLLKYKIFCEFFCEMKIFCKTFCKRWQVCLFSFNTMINILYFKKCFKYRFKYAFAKTTLHKSFQGANIIFCAKQAFETSGQKI